MQRTARGNRKQRITQPGKKFIEKNEKEFSVFECSRIEKTTQIPNGCIEHLPRHCDDNCYKLNHKQSKQTQRIESGLKLVSHCFVFQLLLSTSCLFLGGGVMFSSDRLSGLSLL